MDHLDDLLSSRYHHDREQALKEGKPFHEPSPIGALMVVVVFFLLSWTIRNQDQGNPETIPTARTTQGRPMTDR